MNPLSDSYGPAVGCQKSSHLREWLQFEAEKFNAIAFRLGGTKMHIHKLNLGGKWSVNSKSRV
jgi:hypothetical protein